VLIHTGIEPVNCWSRVSSVKTTKSGWGEKTTRSRSSSRAGL